MKNSINKASRSAKLDSDLKPRLIFTLQKPSK